MSKLLSFCFSLLLLLLIPLSAIANNGPAFTGSSCKIEDEMASATEIVIGKFAEINRGGSFTMSGDRYRGKIATTNILKGNALPSSEVSFLVIPETKESVPNLADTYIFIIHNHHIDKLLPATADNIAKVKALIAQALKVNSTRQP